MKRNSLVLCGVMTLAFAGSRVLAYEDDYLTTTDSGVTVIDTEEGNRVYVFTTAGTELTATLKRDMKLDQVLLVGGGGGGGGFKGGGGGAGQVIHLQNLNLLHSVGVSYRFTVGSGGTAGTSAFNVSAGDGGDGLATSFAITGADIGGSASYSAAGGGGGGRWGVAGHNGACGGGAGGTSDAKPSGGVGSVGGDGGNNVGVARNAGSGPGGGGMGRDLQGADGESTDTGLGGAGYLCSITGVEKEYGRGGDGGGLASAAAGALGSGNGGGGGAMSAAAYSGGSGTVILAFSLNAKPKIKATLDAVELRPNGEATIRYSLTDVGSGSCSVAVAVAVDEGDFGDTNVIGNVTEPGTFTSAPMAISGFATKTTYRFKLIVTNESDDPLVTEPVSAISIPEPAATFAVREVAAAMDSETFSAQGAIAVTGCGDFCDAVDVYLVLAKEGNERPAWDAPVMTVGLGEAEYAFTGLEELTTYRYWFKVVNANAYATEVATGTFKTPKYVEPAVLPEPVAGMTVEEAMAALRPQSHRGPKVLIIGDSYSTFYGCIPEDYAAYYAMTAGQVKNGVENPSYTWWYKFIKAVDGYLVRNDSYSGSTIAWWGIYAQAHNFTGWTYWQADRDESFCERVKNLGETEADRPDLILVFGGTNDNWMRQRVKEGDASQMGPYTFDPRARDGLVNENDCVHLAPAIHQLMWVLRNKYPLAKTMFIINSRSTVNYGGGAPTGKEQDGMTDEYIEAIDVAARGLGCATVKLKDIGKENQHPNVEGMVAIAQQVADNYNAWKSMDWEVISPSAGIGADEDGSRSETGDEIAGTANEDFGFWRLVNHRDAGGVTRHYRVIAVTNDTQEQQVDVPADTAVEYLLVGGGGGAGTVFNAKYGGCGGAGALNEGFRRWEAATTLTVRLGVGGSHDASNNGLPGLPTVVYAPAITCLPFEGDGGSQVTERECRLLMAAGGGGGANCNSSTMGVVNDGSLGGTATGGTRAETNQGRGIYAHAGGIGYSSTYPGGGGGAGGVGGDGSASAAGTAGAGLIRAITGEAIEYARGGDATTEETVPAALGYGGNLNQAGGSGVAIFRYEISDEQYETLLAQLPKLAAKPKLTADSAVYDGADHRPALPGSIGYQIRYSAEEWINAGEYRAEIVLNDGYQWEDDLSEEPLTLDFTITQAENEWVTEPTISKVSWLEQTESGVVDAGEARFGTPVVTYDGGVSEMPTIPGVYTATVAVPGCGNYSALNYALNFEITFNSATRESVEIPELPESGTVFAYDGTDHHPSIAETDLIAVSYSKAQWTEIGVYTLTLSLKDPGRYMWADETVQNRIYTYYVREQHTSTTGTPVEGTLENTTWGRQYVLCDDGNHGNYRIVVVTNANESVSVQVPAGTSVEYLIVGGGGGAGGTFNRFGGGGGGAGAFQFGFLDIAQSSTIVVSVGAGGAGDDSDAAKWTGSNGGDTTLSMAGQVVRLATGGGAGGAYNRAGADSEGGSGGGGPNGTINAAGSSVAPTDAASAESLGHNGGAGFAGNSAYTGGGGGAGSAGADAASNKGGNGGDGVQCYITGEGKWYAAGGGGAYGGVGGSEVGGSNGQAAVANTGSGGGAGDGHGGAGSEGIAVLRFRLPEGVPLLSAASLTVTDTAAGTVAVTATVPWLGGEEVCDLVLKYGKTPGVYSRQTVVCAGASAGEIEGTATISRGTWYGVLVARTAAGESVASQEFQFVSEKRHQGVIVVIK